MADLAKLVDELSKLTVIEAAELSKMLEEKWGVSAAAPVAVAAAAGGAGGVQLFGLADGLGGIHAAEHDPAVLRQAADQIRHIIVPPIGYTA